jgi:hypothetical protein
MNGSTQNCLYTSQGEVLCKRIDDNFYGKNVVDVVEGFYGDAVTRETDKYAQLLYKGCYTKPNATNDAFEYVPGSTCDQMIANIAVDMCNLNNKKVCGVSQVRPGMSLCSAAPYNLSSEWVSNAGNNLRTNMATMNKTSAPTNFRDIVSKSIICPTQASQ